ncbi:MAG: cyclic nucleotide-binding domain-containing protein [Oligoflexia bacterium]|nr:cyclic nucleotide-binding domain-containing protein [Oligoflexia bacterium]
MADHFEVAIIGAGPAGLAAAANAAQHKLSHVLIERREIGNTIYDYQLRKFVMAEPGKLPLRGQIPFQAGTREQILDAWNKAVAACAINVRRAEVAAIKKIGEHFEISSKEVICTAKHVILAIGVQGSPRKLGVPGEAAPVVAYTLSDPDQFQGKDIIVVGAGDAAIENALGLSDGNNVSIVNRGDDFPRAKDANSAKIMDAIRAQKVRMYANSEVARLEPGIVVLNTPQGEESVACDHLIARLGCILPRKFLESCGIQFPSADAAAVPIVTARYESNVPGLYILGALIGYPLIKQAINQGYEVIEHILGHAVEPADQVLVDEKLAVLPGSSAQKLQTIRSALPLWSDLSEAQFRELIIESTVRVLKDGEIVFQRNDYTDTFFSIVEGEVQIEVPHLADGIKLQTGSYFGEMGLMSGRRRTATVRACGRCTLIESPRKQVLKLVNSVASVKREIDKAFLLRALETSVFPEVSRSVLQAVVSRAQYRHFKKGEALFKQGEIGDVLYFIRKGSVKVSRRHPTGQEVTQTYLPAGSIVGEMALLSEEPQPRSASVAAVVPCEVVAIQKSDFLEILKSNQAARHRLTALARSRELENASMPVDPQLGSVLDFMMAQGVTDADNFLLIDSDRCVGCDNCESACAATHGGYSRLDRKGGKSFASIQIPVSCRHCENPLCMLDCPPDALTRMPNGEVVIRDCCIGCGNCVRNCPYGVIRMVYQDETSSGFSLFSLFRKIKSDEHHGPAKAGKCDLCSSLSGGPACVRACPTGAAMRVNPSRMLAILAEKR